MSILVIVEHHHHEVRPSTFAAITAAKQMGSDIQLLIAGHSCQSIVEKLRYLAGIKEILVADHPTYQQPLAENLIPLILHCAQETTHILAPATAFGKNILPSVAAKLNVSPISDIVAVLDAQTFCRPIYAGNAIATVQSLDPIKVITVRSTAFAPAAAGQSSASVRAIDFVANNTKSQFIRAELHTGDRPELSSAGIVISGGRGLQNSENFARLMKIADRLGAAIGASRAAVDAGLAPNDFQVGQTGQVVAPKLYIAVGISGAIQHLAGMKDSKIIVAINKDADAPIFQVADYGVVADIQDVLPQWEQVLTEMGY